MTDSGHLMRPDQIFGHAASAALQDLDDLVRDNLRIISQFADRSSQIRKAGFDLIDVGWEPRAAGRIVRAAAEGECASIKSALDATLHDPIEARRGRKIDPQWPDERVSMLIRAVVKYKRDHGFTNNRAAIEVALDWGFQSEKELESVRQRVHRNFGGINKRLGIEDLGPEVG